MSEANKDLTRSDISDEEYREYDIPGRTEPYRINHPLFLFTRSGGTTHRILDKEGIVHCVLFPGSGTVLRWKPKDASNPVQF